MLRAEDAAPLPPLGRTPIFYIERLKEFRHYTLKTFKLDVIAGFTVSLVSLPLAMAFAAAAGLGPDIGLVSAIVAGAVAAIFGGSEINISGPAGSLIGVLAGVLAANKVSGLEDVIVLGLVGGALLIVAGLVGLGKFVRYVPFPVIVGFTGGIGIIIIVSQMGDALGLENIAKSPYFHENVGAVIAALDRTTIAAAGVTLLTIAIIEGAGRVIPKAFAPLLGIGVAGVIVWVFKLKVVTLEAKYGAIPQSLPTPSIPKVSIDQVVRLLPAGFTLASLCALETLLSATASDAIVGKRHNSRAELIGCGLANMVSPLFGGIPICGAIARTTLNARGGAQTRVAAIFNAISLLLIMLFLAPVVGKIPTAALAGLLILIAIKMIEVARYRSLLVNHHWTDFAMTAVTLLATVFISLAVGIALGLGIAAVAYFIHGRAEGGKPAAEYDPDDEDITVASIDGALFFHTARQVVLDATQHDPTKVIVVCIRNTDVIDASGIEALKDVVNAHKEDRLVYLSGVTGEQRDLLDRTGVLELVGMDHVFETRDEAIKAAKAA